MGKLQNITTRNFHKLYDDYFFQTMKVIINNRE